jgi:CRISPR-associated endoribonuclease Cas6
MYLVALLLTLRLIEEVQDPVSMEAQALAYAIKHLLQQETVHGKEVGITAAMLRKDEDYVYIRLSLTGSDVMSVITSLHELVSCSPLHLCQRRYEVASIDLAHPTWSRVNSWADIMAPSADRIMRFSFATPMITKESANQTSRDALPFPEPITLFSSVIDSWLGLGRPGLPTDAKQLVQTTECVISLYRLRTSPVSLGEHSCTGYLGWIEYECRHSDHPYLASLNALARLAFFIGAGYYTAQGMGVTNVLLRS